MIKFLLCTILLTVLPGTLGQQTTDNDESGGCNKPQGSLTSNPTSALFPANFADPCIIETGGKYYAFATNHGGKDGPFVNVPIATSNDFTKGWQFLADKTNVLPDPGKWVVPNSEGNAQVGAPDVQKIVSRPSAMRSRLDPLTASRMRTPMSCIIRPKCLASQVIRTESA